MTLRRRPLLLGAAALLARPAPAADDTPQRLRAEAEAALSQGALAAAQGALERAAGMAHEAETEMALVRLAMQAGRYKEALALAAHAAGAHRDHAGAALLYGWLLALGGRPLIGQRILDGALQRAPGHPLLGPAHDMLAQPAAPPAAMRVPPHRLAPYAWGAEPSAAAQMVCTGFADGVRAVVPLAPVRDAPALWVRSARGPTSRARVDQADSRLGIAWLVLETALPASDAPLAADDPFPGSPMAVIGAPLSPAPAWPWLFSGFAGRVALDGSPRSPGVEAPGCADGAVVLDASGRLAGLVVSDSSGQQRWVEPRALGDAWTGASVAPAPVPASRLPVDALYEAGLSAFVQVLADTRS